VAARERHEAEAAERPERVRVEVGRGGFDPHRCRQERGARHAGGSIPPGLESARDRR